jgi:hypothetical protein
LTAACATAPRFLAAFAFNGADEGFVRFNDLAEAAHRAKLSVPHRLANPMAQKPRGLVGHLQDAMELMRRTALL